MRRFFTHHIVCWLLCLLAGGSLQAQSLNIRRYTVADGLPSSVIYRCAQDQRGFMWFGTESGITRFDGKSFRNFSIPDGLTDTEILDIFCAANGELWLIPFGGSPMRFDPVTEVCYTAANDPELRKIVYKGILYITQVDGKDIFFSYSNSTGLYRYANGKVNEISIPGVTFGSIKSIHGLAGGRVLINMPEKSLALDVAANKAVPVKNLPGEVISINGDTVFSYRSTPSRLYSTRLLPGLQVQPIDSVEISSGVRRANQWKDLLYFCNHTGGLDIYDHSLHQVNNLLKDVVLNTTFMDREGNLWLCSYTKGVYSIPVSRIRIYNMAGALADDYISALQPLAGNKVLSGFISGKIQEVDISNGAVVTRAGDNKKELGNRVRRILLDPDNKVLALTESWLYYSDPGSTILKKMEIPPNTSLNGKDIFNYKKGHLLVACTHNLLDIDYINHIIDTVYRGRTTCVGGRYDNDAWFSTLNGVFYIKDISRKQYEYIGDSNPLLARRMNNIIRGEDGLLWLASANAGVLVLKDNKLLAQVAVADGLSSDLCRDLFIDNKEKRVWVATNNGISVIRYAYRNDSITFSINNYNTSHGLPDNDINKVSLYDDKIYAATANGLAVFPPLSPIQNIPVHVVELLVEGKKRAVSTEITLQHYENDISISFTGICFTCSGQLDYQYRMLKTGSDTNWISTRTPVVNFSALHPGRYVFEAKTATGSSVTSVWFIIRRPWYAQTWFWIVCGLALLGIILFIYNQRVKRIALKSKQAQQMAQLELQALRAQMNPHFLFNSLNAIQHFISENEGARAQNYLGSFSRLMRLILESSRSNYVSLAQEKELLSLYLELEQVRFNNRFRFSIDIDPELNIGYEIPTMLIQPFAENAVNHGLFDKPGQEGRIWIRFYRDKGDLCCEVEDNGIGRQAAALLEKKKKHVSRGMQITEERLKTLEQSDGLKTRILVEDKYDEQGKAAGTKITIRITDPELTQ